MTTIRLETKIYSTAEVCFDLSRSIDLHIISTSRSNEKAVEGKVTGLINLNEYVTWEATHFGIRQRLSTLITEYKRPWHFRDEQIHGAFKEMIHDHFFEESKNGVIMKDVFYYATPYGVAGKLFDMLVLKNYMTKLLIERNNCIKQYAESGEWRSIVK